MKGCWGLLQTNLLSRNRHNILFECHLSFARHRISRGSCNAQNDLSITYLIDTLPRRRPNSTNGQRVGVHKRWAGMEQIADLTWRQFRPDRSVAIRCRGNSTSAYSENSGSHTPLGFFWSGWPAWAKPLQAANRAPALAQQFRTMPTETPSCGVRTGPVTSIPRAGLFL